MNAKPTGIPVAPLASLLASAFALAGCSKADHNLTFYKDVQPILTANCTGCHMTGGIAPFELTSYASAQAHGALLSAAVQSHVMPPWMPSSDTPPMLDTRTLTDAQIQTLTTWVSEGMEEGNPADAAVITPPATFAADATLEVAAPYTPNLSLGTDDYHCFVLDPQLTTATAITALNILPGDRRVVHHVIVYAVDPSNLSELQSLEAGGDGNGYTCFGSSGVSAATTVGGWVPGTLASYFPEGTGVVLQPGSLIVIQVHYNLLTIQNTTDQTTAEFQYAAASSVTPAYVFPALDDNFSIPPGAVQTISETFDTNDLNLPDGIKMKIWGVLPHMHLHGTDISVTGQKADGTNFNFVHIPKWDFSWQEFYFYQEPIEVEKGDKLTLSCTFDNTQANQPVINGVQEVPQTLTWGEDTLNEMCLNFFYGTFE